jgi:hypothetical protein
VVVVKSSSFVLALAATDEVKGVRPISHAAEGPWKRISGIPADRADLLRAAVSAVFVHLGYFADVRACVEATAVLPIAPRRSAETTISSIA